MGTAQISPIQAADDMLTSRARAASLLGARRLKLNFAPMLLKSKPHTRSGVITMADRPFPSYFIYRDKQKKWRWSYEASNGETISVSSESYRLAHAHRAWPRPRQTLYAIDQLLRSLRLPGP